MKQQSQTRETLKSRLLSGKLFTPARIACASSLLLLLCRLLRPLLESKEGFYIGSIVMQIMIFILPATIRIRMKDERYLWKLHLKPARPETLLLSLSSGMLLITGGLLLSLLFSGISHLSGTFTLYESFEAERSGELGNTLYLLLAYAVLPAIAEELFFRGILRAEYERYGAEVAVLMTSILFTCLHFSLTGILVYFFSGIVLAITAYLSRSVTGAILAHFLYNLFGLFGQPYISSFFNISGNKTLFIFVLISLFLLSLALFCGEIARLCRLYAIRNVRTIAPRRPEGVPMFPRKLMRHLLLAPDTILCYVIWLLSSILFGIFSK